MSAEQDGPYSAFPSTPDACLGLTKREVFAAMAMQGLCAAPDGWAAIGAERVAKFSVQQADALLAELAKKPEARP